MKLKLLLIFVFFFNISTAQKQGNKWYFGLQSALDFNSGSPVAVSGCAIVPLPPAGGWFLGNEGCASLADDSGNLLLYSEGQHVWNRNNQVMPNGSGLLGCYSSTSAAFIIPVPLSNRLLYLFTTDCLENNLANGLRYSMVDMCLDGGNGDVVSGQKNILLLDTVSEKLTGINHPNGKDIWLIAHKHYSDAFYAYLITETGITDTVISHTGSVHGPSTWQAIGQMKASPDGKKIAAVIGNSGVSIGELFDFNDTTGVLSNPISLTPINHPYGLEFSPDNSKLYTYGLGGLNQYDLTIPTQVAINSSKTLLTSASCVPCGMQLGPDGKIYIAGDDAILYPNLPGTACGFTANYLSVSAGNCFPGFISSYQYHNHQYDCTGTFVNDDNSKLKVDVFPNPFSTYLNLEHFHNVNHAKLEIFNLMGELVFTKLINGEEEKINCSFLSDGPYFLRITSGQDCRTEKVFKQQ